MPITIREHVGEGRVDARPNTGRGSPTRNQWGWLAERSRQVTTTIVMANSNAMGGAPNGVITGVSEIRFRINDQPGPWRSGEDIVGVHIRAQDDRFRNDPSVDAHLGEY
jgi:hypothetical protein